MKRPWPKDSQPTCQWFFLCANRAGRTRQHSILGEVPICSRCDEKVERLSEGAGTTVAVRTE